MGIFSHDDDYPAGPPLTEENERFMLDRCAAMGRDLARRKEMLYADIWNNRVAEEPDTDAHWGSL